METQLIPKISTRKTLKLGIYILIYGASLILLLKVITELNIDQTANKGGIKPAIEQTIEGTSP